MVIFFPLIPVAVSQNIITGDRRTHELEKLVETQRWPHPQGIRELDHGLAVELGFSHLDRGDIFIGNGSLALCIDHCDEGYGSCFGRNYRDNLVDLIKGQPEIQGLYSTIKMLKRHGNGESVWIDTDSVCA
jgi:hypothetical protein